MKTIETLYKEILESDELKKSFTEAAGNNQLGTFLKDNGCDAEASDLQKFLAEQKSKEGAISDAELGSASGGCNGTEATMSVFSVGIGCAVIAVESKYRKGESSGDDEFGKVLCEAYDWNN